MAQSLVSFVMPLSLSVLKPGCPGRADVPILNAWNDLARRIAGAEAAIQQAAKVFLLLFV